jgi:hypothetical protein
MFVFSAHFARSGFGPDQVRSTDAFHRRYQRSKSSGSRPGPGGRAGAHPDATPVVDEPGDVERPVHLADFLEHGSDEVVERDLR